jgi:hypothetical protein
MKPKKFYFVQVVTASTKDEAKQKVRQQHFNEDHELNREVLTTRQLFQKIADRSCLPVKHRYRKT